MEAKDSIWDKCKKIFSKVKDGDLQVRASLETIKMHFFFCGTAI
jgi:hypothetical protein